MATEYTPEMRAELVALSPVNNEKAMAFAEKHGISVFSVRAVCNRADDIVYEAKPKVRKDGSKVELKSEIVGDIAEMLGVDADRLETLGNANRDVLVLIRAALPEESE